MACSLCVLEGTEKGSSEGAGGCTGQWRAPAPETGALYSRAVMQPRCKAELFVRGGVGIGPWEC